MDSTEQIYQLVEQWCHALDPWNANAALRQIAVLTGCLSHVSQPLSEEEGKYILRWLKDHHPNAYLWAMSQHSIGHPAMVWGTVKVSNSVAFSRK